MQEAVRQIADDKLFILVTGLASLLGCLLAMFPVQARSIDPSVYRTLIWQKALLWGVGLGLTVASLVAIYQQPPVHPDTLPGRVKQELQRKGLMPDGVSGQGPAVDTSTVGNDFPPVEVSNLSGTVGPSNPSGGGQNSSGGGQNPAARAPDTELGRVRGVTPPNLKSAIGQPPPNGTVGGGAGGIGGGAAGSAGSGVTTPGASGTTGGTTDLGGRRVGLSGGGGVDGVTGDGAARIYGAQSWYLIAALGAIVMSLGAFSDPFEQAQRKARTLESELSAQRDAFRMRLDSLSNISVEERGYLMARHDRHSDALRAALLYALMGLKMNPPSPFEAVVSEAELRKYLASLAGSRPPADC